MDRYFGQQLRRLQAKEDEIAQRAQELVTKEKTLRGGKMADDDKDKDKVSDDFKRREVHLPCPSAPLFSSAPLSSHIPLHAAWLVPALRCCRCRSILVAGNGTH